MSDPSPSNAPVAAEELTPRQREVLALLARGKTNFQIAEALGVSLEGAKYHVREIMGRLGVESREAAADWWRAERRPTRRARGMLASVGTGSAVRWIGVAIAGGLIAGFAVLAVLLFTNGDEEVPAAVVTVVPPASSTPSTPTATPGTVPAADTPSAVLPASRVTPIGGDPAALANGRLVVYTDELAPGGGLGPTEVVTFDLDRGRIVAAFGLNNVGQIRLAEEARKLFIIEGTALVERDLDGNGGRVLYRLPPDAFFNAILPSPDGKQLAIGIEVGQRDPQETKLIVLDLATARPTLELPVAAFSALGFSGSPAPYQWDDKVVVVYGAAGKDGTLWPTARVTMSGDITIIPPVSGGPSRAPVGNLAVRRSDDYVYSCTGIGYVFDAEAIIEQSTSKTVADLRVDGDILDLVRWSTAGDAVLLRAFPKSSRDGFPCFAGSESAPTYFVWEGGVLARVSDLQALLARWDGDRFLEIECQGAKQRPDYPLAPNYLVCDPSAQWPATIYLGGQRIDTVRVGAILGFLE